MRAELADGRILEFPDGTEPAVVQATVKRLMSGDFGKQAPSQAQVRRVDNAILPKGPNPNRIIPGDAGSALSAGAAMDAVNKYLDHLAYSGGSGVSDIAAKVASPEVAAGAGLATNVGIQAIPMLLGGEVSKLAEPGFTKLARGLMTSALKPDKLARESGKGAEAVQTLLDKGANVTEGGVAKIRERIDQINSEIQAKIKGNPGKVDVAEVTKALDQAAEKFKKQVTPQSDLATIEARLQDFKNHPLIAPAPITLQGGVPAVGKRTIPVETAQELKQGTYRALGQKSYGELKGADTEAQKALARGLKDEIAKAVPGLDKLNAEESKLLNAELLAHARVLADANRNPVGLGWIASHPVETIAWILDRSPLVKSLLARAAYSGRQQIPANLGRAAGATAGYVSGQQPNLVKTIMSSQEAQ